VVKEKKNRRFIYSLARSSCLLFASLALLVSAGKRLVNTHDYRPRGWVALLVNPSSADDDTSIWAISTIRKNKWCKDGKLHSQGNISGRTHQEKNGKLTKCLKPPMFRARIHLHDRCKRLKMSKMLMGIGFGRSGYCRCRGEG